MRHSDFWRLVDEEFGPGYGRTLVRDQVLGALGHRTGEQALRAGETPRAVWLALCEEMDVPEERRLGKDDSAVAGRPARARSGSGRRGPRR